MENRIEELLSRRERVAIHEAGHAITCLYHNRNVCMIRIPDVISIYKKQDRAFKKSSVTRSRKRISLTPQDILNVATFFYAGLVAELLVFGEHTYGAYNDITIAAERLDYYISQGQDGVYLPISAYNPPERQEQLKKLSIECTNNAKTILYSNIKLIHRLQLFLLDNNTLERDMNNLNDLDNFLAEAGY